MDYELAKAFESLTPEEKLLIESLVFKLANKQKELTKAYDKIRELLSEGKGREE